MKTHDQEKIKLQKQTSQLWRDIYNDGNPPPVGRRKGNQQPTSERDVKFECRKELYNTDTEEHYRCSNIVTKTTKQNKSLEVPTFCNKCESHHSFIRIKRINTKGLIG